MTAPETPKSTSQMLSDILGNVSNLVRNEADLARAEIAESMNKAVASLAAMAVALALAITGLNVLAASLVVLVVRAGLPPEWAPLAVGVGLILIAMVIFISARSVLRRIGFVPTRASRNVKRDAAIIKDSFNDK